MPLLCSSIGFDGIKRVVQPLSQFGEGRLLAPEWAEARLFAERWRWNESCVRWVEGWFYSVSTQKKNGVPSGS